jgi:hypothetical protein
MSRSLSYLRRALFGVSCAVVFGFGATQALATPAQASMRNVCNPDLEAECDRRCKLEGEAQQGYCIGTWGPYWSCECYVP